MQLGLFFNAVLLGVSTTPEFLNFVEKYNKTYASSKEMQRASDIFEYNMQSIYLQPYTFNQALNEFSDIHPYDFHNNYKGFNKYLKKTTSCKPYTSPNSLTVPDSVDWRDKNAVTPVKNQGQCGSCWSFSATGAMEGAWAIAKGELLSLSEQQLMDCSISYGDMVCNGGLMDNAFEYAIDNGMCTEDEDPYEASRGSCVDCDTKATFSGCVDVTPNNQLELKEAVAQGPVSVAIQADTAAFQFYSGGVITGNACGTNLDHGVLVVGYGEEDGQMYWLVKNSWGDSWGDQGYVKIARTESKNDPGVCGIGMQPSYPIATV
tara:strand:+ start:1191 stop:2147 length:957 start_codon:yes stop_codon:yes gene_type:complete